MQKITPCLWFDTEAEEAAEFYVSLFADAKILDVTHYGEAGPRPAGTVMTVSFMLEGQEYLALNGGPEFPFTEAVSFSVSCEDQEEVDRLLGRACSRAAESRASAAGSRTGSACPGRSSPPRCRGCSATRTRSGPSARWRRCCR